MSQTHQFIETTNKGYLVIYCRVCALVAQDWSTSDNKRAEIKQELEKHPFCKEL